MFTIALLRHNKRPLDRKTLRAPFFSQCYLAAPLAFVVGIISILLRQGQESMLFVVYALGLCITIWYVSIQTLWFRNHTKATVARSVWMASGTWFLATGINLLITLVGLGIIP